MKTFVVYFKYTSPGAKKPGPVRHYKLQAGSAKEAQQLLRQYTTYRGLDVIRVEQV